MNQSTLIPENRSPRIFLVSIWFTVLFLPTHTVNRAAPHSLDFQLILMLHLGWNLMTKLFFLVCVCICVKVGKESLTHEWLPTSIFWWVCSFIPSCLLTSKTGENTPWVFRKLLSSIWVIIYFLISFFSIHFEQLWLLSLQKLSNWKTSLWIC